MKLKQDLCVYFYLFNLLMYEINFYFIQSWKVTEDLFIFVSIEEDFSSGKPKSVSMLLLMKYSLPLAIDAHVHDHYDHVLFYLKINVCVSLTQKRLF